MALLVGGELSPIQINLINKLKYNDFSNFFRVGLTKCQPRNQTMYSFKELGEYSDSPPE